MWRTTILAGLLLIPFRAMAESEVCVENGTDGRYLFVAEARDGVRQVRSMGPGGILCSSGAGSGGVVSVFENAQEHEGCSRLVRDGETEVLLDFVDIDRCRWSSHDR